MENLNAEQVKKALECWASGKPCEGGVCDLFDASIFTCDRWTGKNALALINSQEQRIKELTKDVERVTKQCGEIIVECDERDAERLMQVAKLTEENERLRADKDYWENRTKESESEYDQAVKRGYNLGTVDSVRSFAERLDKHFCHDPAFLGVEQRLIMDVIDQVAKEMLEGK